MTLLPNLSERMNRARGDLRMGLPVLVEGEGGSVLLAAVETLTPERLADLRKIGRVELAITGWRAETLNAPAYDGDVARIQLPEGEGLAWLAAMADPADDLRVPMKGPFRHIRDGSAEPHRMGIALTKAAFLLPAVVAVRVDAATPLPGLTTVPADGRALMTAEPPLLAPVVSARLPMQAAGAGQVHVFRPHNGGEEHYAIEIGRPDRAKPVLTRLHSACFTGDVLGSLKCDCGPQLHAALTQMGAEGAGVLLYLNQEGRGIGLANKMRAYALQDQGFDTVEANHRLGFEDDERDFRIGAGLLRKLGFGAVRLLTNNPRKISMMEAQGITVAERVPLHVGQNAQNAGYLATKVAKSGHLS